MQLKGFTVLQLLITLVITLILLLTAVPGYNSITQRSRMTRSINTMVAHLMLARSEAIKRGNRVALCPSRQGIRCDKSMEWHHGFILYIDDNQNDRRDKGETILRRQEALTDGVEIYSSTGRKRLKFTAAGMFPASNATISFCDARQRIKPRALILSITGRTRMARTKPNGKPLACVQYSADNQT